MAALRGYDVSPQVKRRVEDTIRDYHYYLDIAGQEMEDEDYYFIPSPGYDRIVTSKTNTISRTTELQAIRISEKKARARAEKDYAEAIIGAIDRGIRRASRTSPRLDRREALYQDLFEYLIEKTPRHLFDRDTRTLSKYRRRAIYYIADEMGLLEN